MHLPTDRTFLLWNNMVRQSLFVAEMLGLISLSIVFMTVDLYYLKRSLYFKLLLYHCTVTTVPETQCADSILTYFLFSMPCILSSSVGVWYIVLYPVQVVH